MISLRHGNRRPTAPPHPAAAPRARATAVPRSPSVRHAPAERAPLSPDDDRPALLLAGDPDDAADETHIWRGID